VISQAFYDWKELTLGKIPLALPSTLAYPCLPTGRPPLPPILQIELTPNGVLEKIRSAK